METVIGLQVFSTTIKLKPVQHTTVSKSVECMYETCAVSCLHPTKSVTQEFRNTGDMVPVEDTYTVHVKYHIFFKLNAG